VTQEWPYRSLQLTTNFRVDSWDRRAARLTRIVPGTLPAATLRPEASKAAGTIGGCVRFLHMAGKTAPEYESPTDEPVSTAEHGAVVNENRAREAVPTGRMRYVLVISMALVIVGFAALYFLLVR